MTNIVDIHDLAEGQRKLNALVRSHIGNINGHPHASMQFGGFQTETDRRAGYFMYNRAIGFPPGVTKTTDLSFGLYFGTYDQFTDFPTNAFATQALVKVEGWGPISVISPTEVHAGEGMSGAPLKKITVLIGQTENTRIISSTGQYDSGWLNDETWTNQELLNGTTGHATALLTLNSFSNPKRVDVEFNLNGNFNALKDIIKLNPKYGVDSTNILAFSGWGQTASGATKAAAFAVHNNSAIEYIHVADEALVSVSGYFSFMTKSPTA